MLSENIELQSEAPTRREPRNTRQKAYRRDHSKEHRGQNRKEKFQVPTARADQLTADRKSRVFHDTVARQNYTLAAFVGAAPAAPDLEKLWERCGPARAAVEDGPITSMYLIHNYLI